MGLHGIPHVPRNQQIYEIEEALIMKRGDHDNYPDCLGLTIYLVSQTSILYWTSWCLVSTECTPDLVKVWCNRNHSLTPTECLYNRY